MNDSQPTPLDFLTAVYLNEQLPLSVRMRAAIEAAPYRHPKLTATALMTSDDFATLLDKAFLRSDSARLINHKPAGEDGAG